MNHLISMFETFMKQTNNNKDLGIYDSETLNKAQMQFEARDRHVILSTPSLVKENLTKSTIERWTM